MEIPIVDTVDIRGTKITVRAVPFSLALKFQDCSTEIEQLKIAAQIIARCCSLEDNSPIDLDCFTVDEIAELTKCTFTKKSNADF